MRKKLILINPVNPRRLGLNINISGRFPPIGLGVVASLTPAEWDIEILDENFDPFVFKKADLIGLTSFTANINRAYEISRIYREQGIPTIIGGIHASMLHEEASKYVDAVVVGAAEDSWTKIIKDFEKGTLKKIYREKEMNKTEIRGARHDLFNPGYMMGSIQTARGCPMDCEFCSVTIFNGGRYRQRPIESVLDEIEAIPQKRFFFVDDNIYGYGKDASERAISLFKGIIDRGIKKEWLSQASINFGEDDKVLEYAAKSGCRIILLGIEAENSSALKDTNKNLNIKFLETYEDIFKRINKHGIAVLGSFIYGMDSDTKKSLLKRTDYILNSSVDSVQISLMTPLPGTRLFSRLHDEGRLLYNNFPEDWDHYDMTEVVFKPRDMKQQDLYEGMFDACVRIYNPVSIGYKYTKTLTATRNFSTAGWAYSTNLNYYTAGLGHYLQRKVFL